MGIVQHPAIGNGNVHSSESEAKSTPSSARSSSSSFTPVFFSRVVGAFLSMMVVFKPFEKSSSHFTPVFFQTCTSFVFFWETRVFFRVSFGLSVVDVQNVFF